MVPAESVPSVSVITVTNRPGSIDITWGALLGQTFQNFEWILCDELFYWRSEEVAQFVHDSRLRHIPAPKACDHLWNLNKSYNEALRNCRGELVVSLQDYIWVPPDGLERFWASHRRFGAKAFAAGVTATYALPDEVHSLEGKVTIFERPWMQPPIVLTRVDEERFCLPPGVSQVSRYDWEINWASAPLEALYDVGGFAEEHDRLFYSCDNVTVAAVAERLGYEFVLDRDNICRAIEHGRIFPRPADWEERHGKFGPWETWYKRWLGEGCPRFGYLNGDGTGGAAVR